ncbi:MAG: hypothetical protein ACOC7O_02465 [Thermoplasmatota archaeon]
MLKTYKLPKESSRFKGKPIGNMLPCLDDDNKKVIAKERSQKRITKKQMIKRMIMKSRGRNHIFRN